MEGQAPSTVPVLPRIPLDFFFALIGQKCVIYSHQDKEKLGKLFSFLKITRLAGARGQGIRNDSWVSQPGTLTGCAGKGWGVNKLQWAGKHNNWSEA